MIGSMKMPSNFQYAHVILHGKPVHQRHDDFRLRHPAMDSVKRAKLFSPFDALKGFNEAVAAKEVLYEFRRELDESQQDELNRRYNLLHELTANSRLARANKPEITVTHFVPCLDADHAAFGHRGQYVSTTGICKKVVMHHIIVNDSVIPMSDIIAVEGAVFSNCAAWEIELP